MTYYLYVKTHNVTGLKYLGQTTQNPFEYKGSGKKWKSHINSHGCDITTEILLETTDKNDLRETGIFFSDLWDVVNSNEWANLKPEEGEGGWGGAHEYARINGHHRKGKTPWNKGTKVKNATAKMKAGGVKSGISRIGQVWWTNGIIAIRSKEQPGESFIRGRLSMSKETKIKISNTLKETLNKAS
jgi:hypothetical protein